MLGGFCCRVVMEHAVDVDRYYLLLRSDLSSAALEVMQRHTHPPVLVE